MQRLLILSIALAVSGATASLALAQLTQDGPIAEVHKPLHPAGHSLTAEHVAAWLQPKAI